MVPYLGGSSDTMGALIDLSLSMIALPLAASEALIDPQVKPHPLCGRSLSSETLGGVGTQ